MIIYHLLRKRAVSSGRKLLLCLFIIFAVPSGYASTKEEKNEIEEAVNYCILNALGKAKDDMTVGQLRADCRARLGEGGADGTALARRIEEESVTEESQFVITSHNPNYLLFAAYNGAGVNREPFEADPEYADALENTEVKFQISLKFPIVKDLFSSGGTLFAAYTNRSFWQLYNDNSSPFRETNHEPEIFYAYRPGWKFGGFNTSVASFGVSHQSNGRSGSLSRSWNRLFAQFVIDRSGVVGAEDNLAISLKPWYRLKEDSDNDDNPNIEHYMGNFELLTVYKRSGHIFSLTARNNLKSDSNRGALQLDWSFPLYQKVRGYVQWFNGYGESLIDYDANVNSIGVGIKLTDWL